MSTVDVERHVLAGLTTAMTGMPPPYEVYSASRQTLGQNWLWAVGHTPFGPYSACRTLSLLARHAAHRNALVGRLEKLLRKMRASVAMLDDFIEEYTPAFEKENARSLKRETNWIDLLYKSLNFLNLFPENAF